MKTKGFIIVLAMILFSTACEEQQFYNPYNQLQEDLVVLDAYLEDNNIDATKSSSGLRYVIVDEGLGSNPIRGSKVTVHYTGKKLDGTIFDSSYDRGEPISYVHGVRQVIAGWDEGLSYIGERGKIILYIPSVLAYGSTGSGNAIGPDENLIFDVELLSVQ